MLKRHKRKNHFTYILNLLKLLCLSVSFYTVWLVISGYFFLTTVKFRNYELSHDFVNTIAKIESFLILSVGIVMYAFPEKSLLGLTNANESHRSLCRTAGALVFSCSYESFCVSEFAWKSDKKQFMLSRFIVSLFKLRYFLKDCLLIISF